MALTPQETVEMLLPLRDAIGRLVEETSRQLEEGTTRPHVFDLLAAGQPLPVDVLETGDQFIVELAAAGVDPRMFNLTAAAQALTVRAQWRRKEEENEALGGHRRYLRCERYTGEITRVIPLPSPIDPERVTAHYERGILRVHAPKTEEVKAIEVSIETHEVVPLGVTQ